MAWLLLEILQIIPVANPASSGMSFLTQERHLILVQLADKYFDKSLIVSGNKLK